MEETVRPLVAAAWRGPNWSHSADDYAYYDADEKPGSSAVEALYALTPEDVAAVNEGRKKRAGILATGNVVELQFYPDTPIGSYHIVHHDLDETLRLALECIGAA